MLYNRLLVSVLALLSTGGIGAGSKFLHDALYPIGVEGVPAASEMEWKWEVGDDAFTNPGICIEKLFPDVLGTNLFNRVEVDNKNKLSELPGPYQVFLGDKPIPGKPAIGCIIMNLKKFEYGRGYWRHAFRGEVVLKTENEGWMWMMGQSTGGGFNFRQVQLKKNEKGKWAPTVGHAGGVGGGIKNLPRRSGFWHLDYHSDPSKECIPDKIGDNHATNRDICKSLKVEDVKSVRGIGVGTEFAGHQHFSNFVENPTDMIFPWPPANRKHANKISYTKWSNTRRNLYHEGKGYYYIGKKDADHMIWHGDDSRKGLWRELKEVCSGKKRAGYNREYSDSITDIFCSETKRRKFVGNTGYDNV